MLQLQPVSVVFLSSSTVADVPHASNNNDDNIIGDELLLNFGAKFQR